MCVQWSEAEALDRKSGPSRRRLRQEEGGASYGEVGEWLPVASAAAGLVRFTRLQNQPQPKRDVDPSIA
jgi:hypothetical protein